MLSPSGNCSGNPYQSSILFGDTMVANIEKDYILLLGYSILYKEYNLTRFNHQKNTTQQKLIRGGDALTGL